MKIERGIWTPWAALLCSECHNGMADIQIENKTVENPNGLEICRCTECGAVICHNEDLASCERLVRATAPRGRLVQTGGMCHAAEWEMPGMYIFTSGIGAWEADSIEVWIAPSELIAMEDPDQCTCMSFSSESEALSAILARIEEHKNDMTARRPSGTRTG